MDMVIRIKLALTRSHQEIVPYFRVDLPYRDFGNNKVSVAEVGRNFYRRRSRQRTRSEFGHTEQQP